MSKGKKLTIAVAILLLIAVGAFFAYWYVPRPLVRDLPLVKVQIFDAKTGIEMDLTEQVDLPAVMELLGEAECCPQWRPGPHSNEEYPLDIKFSGGGRTLDRDTGEQRRFCCGQFPKIAWRILEGGQLWQELQPLLPELGA